MPDLAGSSTLVPGYRDDWLNDASTPECGVRCLLTLFGQFGFPRSLLDVGCGVWGHLPRVAASLGVESVGVDIAVEDVRGERFQTIQHDLRQPLSLGDRQFDLVTSWEVGEHLPESVAERFVDDLARYTRNLLVFTAAVLGQGGDDHINCQPLEYWREKIERRGLEYKPRATQQLSDGFRMAAPVCSWYWQNLQVFRR